MYNGVGLYIFSYRIVVIKSHSEPIDYDSVVVLDIYDISLTHISHLTPLLIQNLKIMWLWTFYLL